MAPWSASTLVALTFPFASAQHSQADLLVNVLRTEVERLSSHVHGPNGLEALRESNQALDASLQELGDRVGALEYGRKSHLSKDVALGDPTDQIRRGLKSSSTHAAGGLRPTRIDGDSMETSFLNVTDLYISGNLIWRNIPVAFHSPSAHPTPAPTTPPPTAAPSTHPTSACTGIGESAGRPATSGRQIKSCWGSSSPPNGYYFIKPPGASSASQVFVDFDGSTSSITTPGGWMRVRYSQDYGSEGSPWGGGCASCLTPVFTWELSDSFIKTMVDDAQEIRQVIQGGCYGSVGWVYDGGNYLQFYTFLSSYGTNTGRFSVPSLMYGFSDINTFSNIGTDECDMNDAVWRSSTIYLKDTTATFLPIRQVWSSDVDEAEYRYFPFVSGTDGGDAWVL